MDCVHFLEQFMVSIYSGLRHKEQENGRDDLDVGYDPSVDESFQLLAEMVPINVSALMNSESKAAFGSFKVWKIGYVRCVITM